MQRTLEQNGGRLVYTLTQKRVKHYNLRVRPDGSVAVSAPPWATQGAVEAFLRSKWDWIMAAQARVAGRSIRLLRWGEDSSFSLLGEEITLHIQTGSPGAARQGNILTITLPDLQKPSALAGLVEDWYLGRAAQVLQEAHRRIWPLFDGMGLTEPRYRLRWMTARWGSCRSATGEITLNKRLFALPAACLEYVLLHECAHLRHPNHGAEFREVVARLMPDCKAREELLREESARCILLR